MRKVLKVVYLVMPLLVAVAWLIAILASNKTFTLAGGAQLAPVADTEPLVIGLSVFIIGYLLFVFMMFSEDIKEVFERKPNKKVNKSKKK